MAKVTRKSLARRAFALVLGWVGFYVLGLAVVGALLSVPFVQGAYGDGPGASGLLCGVAALWVAWGLLPRFSSRSKEDDSVPTAQSQHLSDMVRDVAAQIGHPAPTLVHLTAHANAYAAARRSPWLGRSGRSTVGIGLPFLAWLDPPALKAIVAHEMGHHVAGDVRLGPWTHRTRRAMGEALDHLEGSSFWLHLPFVAYGEFFMRASLGVSRAQELAADAVSSQTSSPEAAASALAISHERGEVWEAYLHTEVIPMLESGFLPQLLAGFDLFLAARDENEAVRSRIAAKESTSEYDTHPSLEDRLAALGVEEPSTRLGSSLSLLESVERAEESVLRDMLVDPTKKLEKLAWSDAGERVWLPRWQRLLAPHEHALGKLKISQLARVAASADEWAEKTRSMLAISSPAAERRRVEGLFSAWLAVQLAEQGFQIEALPGFPVRAIRGSQRVEPFNVVKQLFAGELSAAEWQGISERIAA